MDLHTTQPHREPSKASLLPYLFKSDMLKKKKKEFRGGVARRDTRVPSAKRRSSSGARLTCPLGSPEGSQVLSARHRTDLGCDIRLTRRSADWIVPVADLDHTGDNGDREIRRKEKKEKEEGETAMRGFAFTSSVPRIPVEDTGGAVKKKKKRLASPNHQECISSSQK